MRSRNRTKMFHVKHFGTIGGPKCTKSAYVLWLEARGIAQNICKFGARPRRRENPGSTASRVIFGASRT
jgi:hypothetical protein